MALYMLFNSMKNSIYHRYGVKTAAGRTIVWSVANPGGRNSIYQIYNYRAAAERPIGMHSFLRLFFVILVIILVFALLEKEVFCNADNT